ncbi:MAG: hypothetical protein ACUZ8H_09525 [Candidatus Anammoxibacter sp.]
MANEFLEGLTSTLLNRALADDAEKVNKARLAEALRNRKNLFRFQDRIRDKNVQDERSFEVNLLEASKLHKEGLLKDKNVRTDEASASKSKEQLIRTVLGMSGLHTGATDIAEDIRQGGEFDFRTLKRRPGSGGGGGTRTAASKRHAEQLSFTSKKLSEINSDIKRLEKFGFSKKEREELEDLREEDVFLENARLQLINKGTEFFFSDGFNFRSSKESFRAWKKRLIENVRKKRGTIDKVAKKGLSQGNADDPLGIR